MTDEETAGALLRLFNDLWEDVRARAHQQQGDDRKAFRKELLEVCFHIGRCRDRAVELLAEREAPRRPLTLADGPIHPPAGTRVLAQTHRRPVARAGEVARKAVGPLARLLPARRP